MTLGIMQIMHASADIIMRFPNAARLFNASGDPPSMNGTLLPTTRTEKVATGGRS